MNYNLGKFLYFEIISITNILTEGCAFILCVVFIWFFASFSLSGGNKISLTFGLSPYKVILPVIVFTICFSGFYLVFLKSIFIDISNKAQYMMMDFTNSTPSKKKDTIKANITIVKKNQQTKDIIILYLNNPYYKKFFTKKIQNFEYELYADKISLITYNREGGVKNWQTFGVINIKKLDTSQRMIDIALTEAKQNDILTLQKFGVEIVEKQNKYHINFDADINFIINQIDIGDKNVFAFSFFSLPLKIANLKLQNLSYWVFEQQFYSTIKNVLTFFMSFLVPMFFLFNFNARSFGLLKSVLSSIVVFLFVFVCCHFFSAQSILAKSTFLIAFLNLIPCLILITIFLILNLKKHC